MSSTPTDSLSGKLFVFNFRFVDTAMGNPCPIVSPPTVCPPMFGCTANAASMYHIRTQSLSPLNIKEREVRWEFEYYQTNQDEPIQQGHVERKQKLESQLEGLKAEACETEAEAAPGIVTLADPPLSIG